MRANAKIDIVRRGGAHSQKFNMLRVSEIVATGADIQNDAARNRVLLGGIANDKAVADKSEDRRTEPQMSDRTLTALDRISIEQRNCRPDAAGPKMQVDAAAILDWARDRRIAIWARGSFDKHGYAVARLTEVDSGDDVTALDSVPSDRNVGKINCRAHARLGRFQTAAVTLIRANTGR